MEEKEHDNLESSRKEVQNRRKTLKKCVLLSDEHEEDTPANIQIHCMTVRRRRRVGEDREMSVQEEEEEEERVPEEREHAEGDAGGGKEEFLGQA